MPSGVGRDHSRRRVGEPVGKRDILARVGFEDRQEHLESRLVDFAPVACGQERTV